MDAFLVMLALCMAASIAICGIPFGLIVSQRMAGVDVREVGSGNIGMTNVARTVGGSAAAITFGLDVGKGVLSMALTRLLLGLVLPSNMALDHASTGFAALTVVYACCVAGHVFSPYLGFHGGKGISVGFGAALALWWPIGLCLLVVFMALALPTRYVSAGSIAAAVSLPIQCLLLWHVTPWATVPLAAVAAVVVWAHLSNIVKLMHGRESRFSVKGAEGLRDRLKEKMAASRADEHTKE